MAPTEALDDLVDAAIQRIIATSVTRGGGVTTGSARRPTATADSH